MPDYRVAVELALTGGIASALSVVSAHMMGIREKQVQI